MDFLDPKKQKAHSRRLAIGYVVIGLVLLLATTVLLYQSLGYGIDRQGRLVHNGRVFVSSLPEGADIYVDGTQKDTTNTSLVLPAGQYAFELKRNGYHDWRRAITVQGGSVQRFDYPFLFPTSLVTTNTKQYAAQPSIVTQSIDRRWLLVQTGTPNSFDRYDMGDDKPVPETLTIPDEVMSVGTTTTGWQEIEWAKDSRHVVLKRLFDRQGQPSTEYILVDREDATKSVNLSVTLGFTPTVLQLRDKAYDQYFAYDQPNGALFTASLKRPTPQPYLSEVLAFQSEGSETVVYATTQEAPPGKTLMRIRQGDDSYTIRQVASDAAPYRLGLANFNDKLFVAVGATSEDKIYVYKDPLAALKKNEVAVPVHILKVDEADYLSFAPDSRFVVAAKADSFASYDAKTGKGYAFKLDVPIDQPLGHASWMDGYHLDVISNGQVVVFDYDGNNRQSLVGSNPAFQPIFDRAYRKLYTLNGTHALTSTHLRTSQDQ
jgi:hypothetical protein